MVGWRNPARYLAPLALVAAAAATYLIVHRATVDKASTPAPLVAPRVTTTTHRTRAGNAKRFYTVRAGDTLSKIAAKTGLTLGTLEALNPTVNPDTLHPSQRLRLR